MTRDALTAALLARDPLLSDEEAGRDATAYHETNRPAHEEPAVLPASPTHRREDTRPGWHALTRKLAAG